MVPASLTEQYSVSKTEDRLLVLLGMVMEFVQRGGDQVCLIFTSSVKSTHRLARLLQVFAGTDKCLGGEVFEISRIVSQDTREAALRAALDGTAKVRNTGGRNVTVVMLTNRACYWFRFWFRQTRWRAVSICRTCHWC